MLRTMHKNDVSTETTPLLDPRDDEAEDGEEMKTSHLWVIPALAIGCFLGAADQTIVISSYGQIGSELNALNKTSWLATAYVSTDISFCKLLLTLDQLPTASQLHPDPLRQTQRYLRSSRSPHLRIRDLRDRLPALWPCADYGPTHHGEGHLRDGWRWFQYNGYDSTF